MMRAAILATLMGLGLAGPAFAEADLFSRDTVSGLVDLRLGAAAGEPSWTQGGFGKTRLGGDATGKTAWRAQIATADLVWNPSIDNASLVLDLQAQPGQSHGIDAAQAYLQYKPAPTSPLRVMARAGLYYPAISLEHEGYTGGAWTVANTITPSAIDSWVGEELKVVGLEGSASYTAWDHTVGATMGVFGYGDTAGALLAFRGWSLSDVTSTATGRLPLPPMNGFIQARQAPFTEPVRELDGRPGVYARLDWRLPSRLQLDAIYYDNAGDKISSDRQQWAWETRFWTVGGRLDLNAKTWLIGQAMTGSTYMGLARGNSVWVDVDFSSAYVQALHRIGSATLSARADAFATSNTPFTPQERYGETGWAATADYKYRLTANLALLMEVVHVWSDRPARDLLHEAPRQSQTTVQGAARLSF
jgi:hypothetical protein